MPGIFKNMRNLSKLQKFVSRATSYPESITETDKEELSKLLETYGISKEKILEIKKKLDDEKKANSQMLR